MMEHQTLGSKLANTIKELEAAKIKSLEDKAAADLAKIRKERETLNYFVDEFRQHLIDTITAGKVPAKKIRDYERQRWIRDAMKGNATHQDIWDGLGNWARGQALIIVAREEHDGIGMSNWIMLTAGTVRPGTRGA